MVGLPYDCLTNPLGAVRLTFEKAVASGSDPTSFCGKDWGALDLFSHFLSDRTSISQVPILNASTIRLLKANTLVRFQGMIQDMLGNEYYAGAYKDGSVWRTNKYVDNPQFPMDSTSDVQVWERRLLYCVPVPGRNLWTESSSVIALNGCTDTMSQHGEKRPRRADESLTDTDLHVSDDELESFPMNKRMREDASCSQSPNSNNKGSSVLSRTLDVERDSFPCLVKIYDSPESELKLNDVFEFLGVLSFDSELTVNMDDHDELSSGICEEELVQLPPSKIPRVHCILHRKLVAHDFLSSFPTMEPKPHLVKEIRESLLQHLTATLGNDRVAAGLMLLHLLSKVHTRVDVDSVAVGKLSLNITRLSKESVSVFGSRLIHTVKSLLPFTQFMPLTVEYLNTASFSPKKDYEINRLMPGALQLADGSHLILDETQLQAGILQSVGVENARLLKNLTELQKLEYDFQFYKMEMTTDVQLLILSEGKSNIVPADLVIPLQPSTVDFFEVVKPETLEAWRWYLATIRSLPHSIGSDMQKVVENDLVAARQADRNIGSQDFSRWLTMARLMSLSFGETCLSLEHWQMVMELERLRRERLK